MLQCMFPPPLDEDDISAAIDGDASPYILAHLDACPACAERLREAQQIEQAIRRHLAYANCPSSQQLGDYSMELLSNDEQQAIRQHVVICARCTAELAALQVFLDADNKPPVVAPSAQFPNPFGVLKNDTLYPGEIMASVAPQFHPTLRVRGGTGRIVTADTPLLSIMLDVQPVEQNRTLIQGQLVAGDLTAWEAAAIEIYDNGNLVEQTTANDMGGFRCGPFTATEVDIRIRATDGQRVLVPGVPLVISNIAE